MFLENHIVKEFCVSEKATLLSSNSNQYVFEVYPSANKTEIKKAIEALFDVKVKDVSSLNRKGKTKRSRTARGKQGKTRLKKIAYVSLEDGHKIEMV